MKLRYIRTMDIDLEDIEVLNCTTEEELEHKINEGEVIKIDNGGRIEYINSNYIMFYEIDNWKKQQIVEIEVK